MKTLYIDRDPDTFREIALHLQGYHITPKDGEQFVKLFADAQFYSRKLQHILAPRTIANEEPQSPVSPNNSSAPTSSSASAGPPSRSRATSSPRPATAQTTSPSDSHNSSPHRPKSSPGSTAVPYSAHLPSHLPPRRAATAQPLLS